MSSVLNRQRASGSGAQAAGHVIEGSGLFDGSTGYLSRTPGSAGDLKTWTFSCLIKPCEIGNEDSLFGVFTDANNFEDIAITSGDALLYQFKTGGANDSVKQTSVVFRDPSAYYHVVGQRDAASGTFKFFVNGTEITDWASNDEPSNINGLINTTTAHLIGDGAAIRANFGSYLSNAVFIDGQALDPASFGELLDNGYWQINDASGLTFGTNGFLIEGGTDMAAGTDSSGNGNNFTKTGTITATNDSPTNDQTNEYGNYCTFDPNQEFGNGSTTKPTTLVITNGNRTANTTSGADGVDPRLGTTLAIPNSGKWHLELTHGTHGSGAANVQIMLYALSEYLDLLDGGPKVTGFELLMKEGAGTTSFTRLGTVSQSTSLADWVSGARLSLDIDFSNMGSVTIIGKKSGSAYFTNASMAMLDEPHVLLVGYEAGANTEVELTLNTGQTAFVDTPATDHVAVATQNFPAPAVPNYEDEYYIEAGISHTNGATTVVTLPKSVSGGAMARIKRTDVAGDWYVVDTVRGANKFVLWNDAADEDTSTWTNQNLTGTTLTLPSALATGTYLIEVFYVGSYFQIHTYTGTGSAHAESFPGTLDTAPGFLVTKTRDVVAGNSWAAYHTSLGATKYLICDTAVVAATSSTRWNDTEPTTTQFTVGTSDPTNISGKALVAYAWANSGPYAFGKYTGNLNADGPVIDAGGSPASIVTKRNDGAWNWVHHAQVHGDNENYQYLVPSATTAINATTTVNEVDFLSTGYKVRDGDNNNVNGSGAEHFYLAFGIQPIQGPAPATQTAQGMAR